MIVLGSPVIKQNNLTNQLLESLARTVKDPENFEFVIIDNSKEPHYNIEDYDEKYPFGVSILRNHKNEGFYYPLSQLDLAFKGNLKGLVHNDVIFYEEGWDLRLAQAFENDSQLGLVGLCGSYEIDAAGGRGSGTMCYFRGEKGQNQAAGLRITDVRPALLLDSLFMMFREEVIPFLDINQDIAPCHFYDKIWCCKTLEHGWRIAVLGSEIDHMGGQTAVGEPEYDDFAKEWCDARGLDYYNHVAQSGMTEIGYNPGLAVYLEAERRFLSEYRDEKRFLPCQVDKDYNISR